MIRIVVYQDAVIHAQSSFLESKVINSTFVFVIFSLKQFPVNVFPYKESLIGQFFILKRLTESCVAI